METAYSPLRSRLWLSGPREPLVYDDRVRSWIRANIDRIDACVDRHPDRLATA
jgi:hypothetical protein